MVLKLKWSLFIFFAVSLQHYFFSKQNPLNNGQHKGSTFLKGLLTYTYMYAYMCSAAVLRNTAARMSCKGDCCCNILLHSHVTDIQQRFN